MKPVLQAILPADHGYVDGNTGKHVVAGVFDKLSFILHPEPGGGFSAIAARLPGVVSEGETEKEAIDNIVEAFQGAVAFYLDERGVIPWTDVAVERTEGCKERWIVVDA